MKSHEQLTTEIQEEIRQLEKEEFPLNNSAQQKLQALQLKVT